MKYITVCITFVYLLAGCAEGYPTGGWRNKDEYIKWLEFKAREADGQYWAAKHEADKFERQNIKLTLQVSDLQRVVDIVNKVAPQCMALTKEIKK